MSEESSEKCFNNAKRARNFNNNTKEKVTYTNIYNPVTVNIYNKKEIIATVT